MTICRSAESKTYCHFKRFCYKFCSEYNSRPVQGNDLKRLGKLDGNDMKSGAVSVKGCGDTSWLLSAYLHEASSAVTQVEISTCCPREQGC